MTAAILTPDGAPVFIAPPPPEVGSYPYSQTGFAVMGGDPDEIVIAAENSTGDHLFITGYDLTGNLHFQDDLQAYNVMGPASSLELTTIPGGGVAAGWLRHSNGFHGATESSDATYGVVGPDGSITGVTTAGGSSGSASALQTLSTANGFILEWQDVGKTGNIAGQTYTQLDRYHADGTVISNNYLGHADPFAWADIGLGSGELGIQDNATDFFTGSSSAPNHLPGEPAHAVTDVAAVALADGHTAAVGFVDSGTDYVSLYDSTTNTFGARIGLDWGGAADMHLVALTDGGFAVSWANGGAYKGELFDSAGAGGGVIGLTGQFAAIDSHGDLYTVGTDSSGNEVIQTYVINGAGGGGTGGGSGGGTGQTYTADNNGDHLTGAAGNDTFNLGRGGDVVTGNGGNDTFKFAEVPWAGAHITDFNAGDVLDLTGLAHTTGDPGADGFADGYLSISSNAQGDAQVWASYSSSGSSPWLVTTLDGVSAASLTHQGDVITLSGGAAPPPSSSVETSDPNYTAPASVNTITLSGSQQTVHASNYDDTTIWSNNTGNQIYGGTGDDVIHVGRAGDTVTGGAGRDLFVFDETPWAPATIKDFDYTSGDSVDVRGLLAHAGYTGADPIADGYLRIQNGEIDANYRQAGNDGWWVVAKGVVGPGSMVYDNGVIHSASSHVGGTYTTSTGYHDQTGYDTLILTGSNSALTANDGGDALIDNGSNNVLTGGRGNDTFILSPSTTTVDTGWGGFDTIVLNAHPTVAAVDPTALATGDRIDLHQLLAGVGYTGSDPIADGYIQLYRQPQDQGQMSPNPLQVQFDPDGHAGSAPWTTVFQASGFTHDPHYSNGWLIV